MYPMQSQMEGVSIRDLPTFLSENQNDKTHVIIVNEPLNPNQLLIIPLVFRGVTSYLPSRKTRASEYKDESIPHIDITSLLKPSETSFA